MDRPIFVVVAAGNEISEHCIDVTMRYLTLTEVPSQPGSLEASGRGLVAVAGQGQLVQVELNEGESFIVHPRSISQMVETLLLR